ncbi:MAG TPA: hypothetical protein VJ045_06340 [Hyphomicrobiaceae bacterium]|nr:hypothetical protein [Hyphomicrobiaceae bacterium]
MDDLDPFEQGTHTFSGIVKVWTQNSAELVTDSGLALFLNTQGQPPVPAGARITVVTRKYRPCYLVMRVTG